MLRFDHVDLNIGLIGENLDCLNEARETRIAEPRTHLPQSLIQAR
jgi:hypothetical protein